MATLFGVKVTQTCQDMYLWEKFFAEHPISALIELGTDAGGMSIFFQLNALQRNFNFFTFDHQDWMSTGKVQDLIGLRACFRRFDVFSEEGIREIAGIISAAKPVAIFFDNGNKPKEWATFAPLTAPGDFLIVHDWGVEFGPNDMGSIPVEQLMRKESDQRTEDWRSMWFRRL